MERQKGGRERKERRGLKREEGKRKDKNVCVKGASCMCVVARKRATNLHTNSFGLILSDCLSLLVTIWGCRIVVLCCE